MPKSKVDQEAFQAWATSQVGQWVRQQLRRKALETAQQVQDQLWAQLPGPPSQWQETQAQAAHRKGLCDGYLLLTELEYDDVREETPEEIAEMEKKAQ